MPTAPPTLTAAPTSPDRSDRATFAARAVALDDFTKNTQIPELQASLNNVYANSVEAADAAITCTALTSVAAAAANYKGLWSALTGALNMPASVSHNGNYWALNANLADVTAATPGVSGSWQALNIGAGGAAEVSSAVNVTLTAASYRVQNVEMTAADKSVIMPDATTLQTGGPLSVIKNKGALTYCVRDSASTLLAVVEPGQTASLYLANGSTSAGVWVVSGSEGVADAIYQATATAVNAVASTLVCVAMLTATTALAVWSVSGFMTAVVLTVSGNAVSVGTVFSSSVAVSGTSPRLRIAVMSASQVIVAYAGTTTYTNAVTLNISAGLVTNGTVLVVKTVVTDFVDVTALTATQALIIYKGTTNYGEVATLNVSGTTLTAGTPLVLMSGSVALPGTVAAISTTQAISTVVVSAIIAYSNLLTVSGTNVTAGATPSQTLMVNYGLAATRVSATQVLLSGTATTALVPHYVLLEVAGATVLARDIADAYGIENGNLGAITQISATKYLATREFKGGSGGVHSSTARAQVINLADSGLRVSGKSVSVKGSSVASANAPAVVASLSATKQLAVYHDTSGYIQARILEIAA